MACWWKPLLTACIVLSPAGLAAQMEATQAAAAAIPAADLKELDRCRPQRVGEASECMRRALGDRTAAEIGAPAGEQYRAAFADLAKAKWRLADPDSPVARDLRGLRIYDPADAAYVLLKDMAARIGRVRLDYEAFARERGVRKPAPVTPALFRKEAAVQPGSLPLNHCRREGDAPGLGIVTCVLNADRTVSRTTSSAPGLAMPPGATEVDAELCRSMGELPAGSRLKACHRLPDGRLLRQTARTAPAE